MRIRELLDLKENREVLSTKPDRSLLEMAGLLLKHRIGALLVTDDDDRLVGIITERDIVRALVKLADEVTVCSVENAMTETVLTCSPDDDVLATLAIMNTHRFRHMPVLENGKPLAMLSIREFDIACQHFHSLSRTDELTGLSNRRHFMESLDAEFKRHDRLQTPLCVAMLDIDKFKSINDTYGHDVGDEVLRQLADILRGRLRSYDVVGRLGGEEFALMFPETDLDDALTVCEHLRERIRARVVQAGTATIRFTASFGVTEVANDTGDCTDVLVRADKLLYRAKTEGRDKVVSDIDESLDPASVSPSADPVDPDTQKIEKIAS